MNGGQPEPNHCVIPRSSGIQNFCSFISHLISLIDAWQTAIVDVGMQTTASYWLEGEKHCTHPICMPLRSLNPVQTSNSHPSDRHLVSAHNRPSPQRADKARETGLPRLASGFKDQKGWDACIPADCDTPRRYIVETAAGTLYTLHPRRNAILNRRIPLIDKATWPNKSKRLRW